MNRHGRGPSSRPTSVKPRFKPLTANISKPICNPTVSDDENSSPSDNEKPTPRRPTLLTLPLECRRKIWAYVFEDVQATSSEPWYSPPVTPYHGLLLVCRKIYHEVQAEFFCRSLVPRNCLKRFTDQDLTLTVTNTIKKLSIQLPLILQDEFFDGFIDILEILSQNLEELQMFFVGRDQYGVKAYLHGCGNLLPSVDSTAQKLCVEGQQLYQRMKVMHQLSRMYRLKTLVISNANMPILAAHLIKYKLKLEKLYVVSDPRSAFGLPYTLTNTPTQLYNIDLNKVSPLKELHICPQAVIGAWDVPSKVARTLEKLTYVVPDISRQGSHMYTRSTTPPWTGQMALMDWIHDTAAMLRDLSHSAEKLHTLRICNEGAIYESHFSAGDLIGAFKDYLPGINSLKKLELHMWTKSPYMGREIITSIPSSIERLYVSDRLIDADNLVDVIRKHAWCHKSNRGLESRVSVVHLGDNDGIVGEDFTITEHVSFEVWNLGFVGYEYDVNQDAEIADENRATLMRLNCWLLDIEHSKPHADRLDEHYCFKPVEALDINVVETVPPEHADIEEKFKELEPPTSKEMEEKFYELMESPLRHDPSYFGMEHAAEKVFRNERAAKVQEVVAKGSCVEVEMREGDHWACE